MIAWQPTIAKGVSGEQYPTCRNRQALPCAGFFIVYQVIELINQSQSTTDTKMRQSISPYHIAPAYRACNDSQIWHIGLPIAHVCGYLLRMYVGIYCAGEEREKTGICPYLLRA